MPTNWQTLQLPLAAGLNQKTDDRARQPPYLDVAKDIQFDELGGIQTRYPLASISTLDDVRRIYPYGDRFIVFTKDRLLVWNPVRNTTLDLDVDYLAVATNEKAVFDSPGDQIDCDRAEVDDAVMVVWYDTALAAVFYAVYAASTGTIIATPTQVSSGSTNRPRVVATATEFLVFYREVSTAKLQCFAYTPSSSTPIGSTFTVLDTADNFNSYYDVVLVPGQEVVAVAARLNPTTSYHYLRVSNGSVLTSVVKARTCDGPIALSVAHDVSSVQIVRTNGTAIVGDRITVTGTDSATNQAIGTASATPVNQLTACHRSVQNSGAYRCYVYWSADEDVDNQTFDTEYNWVNTSGTIGTESRFKRQAGVVSRAFDYEGSIYVWLGFAQQSVFSGAGSSIFRSQLQNTYFLYRDDGMLCARAASCKAGGHAPSTGHLPAVTLTTDSSTSYAWAGTQRQVIDLGGNSHSSYGARAPLDIVFTFDSNEARRVATLGKTLYITSGEGVMQFDGANLSEVGFHLYPFYLAATETAGGSIATNGDYYYKGSWKFINTQGEQERSTTATTAKLTLAGAPGGGDIAITPLYHTHKQSSPTAGIGADAYQPAVEVWRTALNPSADSPFYLVTSKDPAVTSNPNRYLENDATALTVSTFHDELSDTDLVTKETHPENGGVLENLASPSCRVIIANDNRLFVAGVAGEPHRVWYSKARAEGEIAAFHDALTIDIPPEGGDITALAFLNETLVVFREHAIYMVPGGGFDNVGGGQNYGPARQLSGDVGAVSAEAVLATERGVYFKSSKGWYLLNRGWSTDYVGGPVSDYDSEEVLAATAMDSRHQIRVLTTGRILVLDTLANQWGEWTISGTGVHAALCSGSYCVATDSGDVEDTAIYQEQTDYSALDYGLDVETAWIKLNDLQGAGRVRAIQLLGEYRSAHQLRIRIAYNYDDTYVDDKYWAPSPTTVGGPLQVRMGPQRQNCEAIKIRISAVSDSNTANPPTGEALKLTGLALEVGVKPTMWRRLPAAQRQ